MKRAQKVLIVAVIVLIVGWGVLRDQVIKTTVAAVATQVIGAPVEIDSLRLGILRQSVEITGFKIYNPPGFSNATLVDIGKINVALEVGALLKGKLHFKNAEFDLKEMTLETNKEGKLNVDALKVAKQPASKEKKKQPAKQEKLMTFQIDELKLGIGKLIMKDYSVPGSPAVKVNEINIHKTYKNITSVQQLTGLVLSEPIKSAGIQGSAIYGAAMLTGAGIFPIAIASSFFGKDSAGQSFDIAFDKVYDAAKNVLQEMGMVNSESRTDGVIAASVKGATVNLELKKIAENKTEARVSARKYMLPEPETAGGVLYNIKERLK